MSPTSTTPLSLDGVTATTTEDCKAILPLVLDDQGTLRATYEPGLWVSINKVKYDILLPNSPIFQKTTRKIAKFGPLFLSSELNRTVYQEILEVTSQDRPSTPPPKTNVWTLAPFLLDTAKARAMNNATFTQDKVKSFQYTLICHAHPVKQRTNWKLGDHTS